MRTKTKALTLSLCAVLLVVTTVFATMAYLTSQDSVNNTFTVGKVEITLDEAQVNDYGVPTDPAARVKAHPGPHLYQGPDRPCGCGQRELLAVRQG